MKKFLSFYSDVLIPRYLAWIIIWVVLSNIGYWVITGKEPTSFSDAGNSYIIFGAVIIAYRLLYLEMEAIKERSKKLNIKDVFSDIIE